MFLETRKTINLLFMGHMKGNDRMKVTSWSYYVGQGTANLIQLAYSGGVKNILIDCGSMGRAEKLPISTAVDKIFAVTGKKLDYIIISHTDLDHINMIGNCRWNTGRNQLSYGCHDQGCRQENTIKHNKTVCSIEKIRRGQDCFYGNR